MLNVNDKPTKIEKSMKKIIDELSEISKEMLDSSWDNASDETMSKIHAEIMSIVFIQFGRHLLQNL